MDAVSIALAVLAVLAGIAGRANISVVLPDDETHCFSMIVEGKKGNKFIVNEGLGLYEGEKESLENVIEWIKEFEEQPVRDERNRFVRDENKKKVHVIQPVPMNPWTESEFAKAPLFKSLFTDWKTKDKPITAHAVLSELLDAGHLCVERTYLPNVGASASRPQLDGKTSPGYPRRGVPPGRIEIRGGPGINIRVDLIPRPREGQDFVYHPTEVARCAAVLLHEVSHLVAPANSVTLDRDFERPAYVFALGAIQRVASLGLDREDDFYAETCAGIQDYLDAGNEKLREFCHDTAVCSCTKRKACQNCGSQVALDGSVIADGALREEYRCEKWPKASEAVSGTPGGGDE